MSLIVACGDLQINESDIRQIAGLVNRLFDGDYQAAEQAVAMVAKCHHLFDFDNEEMPEDAGAVKEDGRVDHNSRSGRGEDYSGSW